MYYWSLKNLVEWQVFHPHILIWRNIDGQSYICFKLQILFLPFFIIINSLQPIKLFTKLFLFFVLIVLNILNNAFATIAYVLDCTTFYFVCPSFEYWPPLQMWLVSS